MIESYAGDHNDYPLRIRAQSGGCAGGGCLEDAGRVLGKRISLVVNPCYCDVS